MCKTTLILAFEAVRANETGRTIPSTTLYSGCSSYVAGSRELIDAVLESELEAYEIELSDAAQ